MSSRTPELEELAKSYDDHMKSFADELDKNSSSPGKRQRSLSRSQNRTPAAAGRSPPINSNAVRANSQPGEVIIGFTPASQRAESPEEQIAAVKTDKRKEGAKPAGNAPKKDPRGPKVDVKSLSKAERRALAAENQEKARARKQSSRGGAKGPPMLERQHTETPGAMEVREKKPSKSAATTKAGPGAKGAGNQQDITSNRVHFFLHLPDYNASLPPLSSGLHPEIVRLGSKYFNRAIMGSSARCAALVTALKAVVQDYKLPAKSEFSTTFYEHLRPMIRYIIECRPQSVSMGNLIRSFKGRLTLCRGKSEAFSKENLLNFLDEFLDERLLTAEQLICDFGVKKIVDGDVIVTFACSFVVSRVLIAAKNQGKVFRLVVVDSNPLCEGKEFLKRMTAAGIDCSYVLLSGLCYVLKEATKVFLGAYALLSNGNLVSRVGTALVAMAAHEYKVPVIVCAETIKFSEKTMLDSITWNEMGDADEMAKTRANDLEPNVLKDWKKIKGLTLLSVYYDVTPREYITMIVTEFGMIPPTSVPVILREYRSPEDNGGEEEE